MVKIEKGKLIIVVDCFEDFEYDTLECLQFDLIHLMNALHILKNSHNPDHYVPSDFMSVLALQKALVPTAEGNKVLYPIDQTKTSFSSTSSPLHTCIR